MSHRSTDPGKGWRLLAASEPVIAGDECILKGCGRDDWGPSANVGHKQSSSCDYRRRIKDGEPAAGEEPTPVPLLDAVGKFFATTGYEKWKDTCTTVDARFQEAPDYKLGPMNFVDLHEAYLAALPPEYVTPTQETLSLNDGPIIEAEFSDSESGPWKAGRLLAIAVRVEYRFYKESMGEWFKCCRVQKSLIKR